MDGGKRKGGRNGLRREGAPRLRRSATLLAVVFAHALLFVALLQFARTLPGSPAGALSVFSLAPPSNAAPRPKAAARPEKPRPRKKDGERNASDTPPVTALPSTKGETCDPLEAVSLALTDDKVAQAALDALPQQSINLANAVAVWTTDWNEASRPPSGLLVPLRATIESALAALPQTCLETPVAGPVFYPFSTENRGYLLIFGSGVWRWAQLIDEPPGVEAFGAGDREIPIFERIFDGL